ncbi:hypothetical protein C8Q77DRAFT_1147818, partial [Trametes polyzona]
MRSLAADALQLSCSLTLPVLAQAARARRARCVRRRPRPPGRRRSRRAHASPHTSTSPRSCPCIDTDIVASPPLYRALSAVLCNEPAGPHVLTSTLLGRHCRGGTQRCAGV